MLISVHTVLTLADVRMVNTVRDSLLDPPHEIERKFISQLRDKSSVQFFDPRKVYIRTSMQTPVFHPFM